jgi:multiple sugar transport system permease protein
MKAFTVKAHISNERQYLRVRRIVPRILVYGILTVFSAIFVFPFLWMIVSSFKPAWDILRIPPVFLPTEWIVANYPALLQRISIGRLYLNSIWVTSLTVLA